MYINDGRSLSGTWRDPGALVCDLVYWRRYVEKICIIQLSGMIWCIWIPVYVDTRYTAVQIVWLLRLTNHYTSKIVLVPTLSPEGPLMSPSTNLKKLPWHVVCSKRNLVCSSPGVLRLLICSVIQMYVEEWCPQIVIHERPRYFVIIQVYNETCVVLILIYSKTWDVLCSDTSTTGSVRQRTYRQTVGQGR